MGLTAKGKIEAELAAVLFLSQFGLRVAINGVAGLCQKLSLQQKLQISSIATSRT